MKTKNIIIIILLLIFPVKIFSQQWSVQLGSGWGDGSFTSSCTSNGSTFVAGFFYGSDLITPIDTLHETVNGDLFITKIDPNGHCEWVKQLHSFTDTINRSGPFAIVIDENNQVVYVSIQIYGMLSVDSISVSGPGNGDIALAKFDFNGNCLWMKEAGGFYYDVASGLTLDSSGDIYICGQNSDQATFGTITLSTAGSFIAKYNPSGNCLWAKSISNTRFQAKFLKYHHSELFMEGTTFDSSRVDTMVLPHISGNNAHVFAGFNLIGNILWAKEAIVTNYSSIVGDISLDGNGNMYSGGVFTDTLNLEGNSFITKIGKTDMFLIKMDSIGNFIWGKQFNSNYTGINSISSSINGNLYITGWIEDTATFNGNIIIPNYSIEMFLAHYDSNGNFQGVIHYGKATGTSISQDANENPYIVSYFYNTLNNGIASYTSYGNNDLLITKYVAINDIQSLERIGNYELLIYANPNLGKCNIKIPDEFQNESQLNLKVFSDDGKIIQDKTLLMNSETITQDLEQVAKGMYHVTLSNGKRTYRGKIVFE